MEASKILFSQQTRAALTARPMSPKHRVKLRKERVKDYIRSKPAGAIISITELGMAAGFTEKTSGGWTFIRSMMRSGEIVKQDNGGPRTLSWSVPDKFTSPTTVEPPTPVMPDPPPAGRVAPHHYQPRGHGHAIRLGNRRGQFAWLRPVVQG